MAAQSRRHGRVMSGHLKWVEAERVSVTANGALQSTVNLSPSFYVSACQQHRNQTITARAGGSTHTPVPPPTLKTIITPAFLVNHKPPLRLRSEEGEPFQRDARTGPPWGRITDRMVLLCLSGLIGHMLE